MTGRCEGVRFGGYGCKLRPSDWKLELFQVRLGRHELFAKLVLNHWPTAVLEECLQE